MTIKKGEIIGVTGLMGAGKTELAGRSQVWINWTGGVYIQGKKVRCPTPQAVFVKGWRTFPRTARPWV